MIKINTIRKNVFGIYSYKVWLAVILSFIIISSVPVFYYCYSLYNEEPLKIQNSTFTISNIIKNTEETAHHSLSRFQSDSTANEILSSPDAVFADICEDLTLHGKYNSRYYLLILEDNSISYINTFNVSDKTYHSA